ncbi:TPA: hypothetical protein N0F65_010967 [Lagenidium giganteum]|uniref:P-type Cu(+) transporter n=1 Tax=Lagenidium giganteum TaxID=4803 RepID=A0AAV2ZCZ8_9STRA|nr:TPA: hypothetical protein N0F65_010967 [Lagenidium giganteum]
MGKKKAKAARQASGSGSGADSPTSKTCAADSDVPGSAGSIKQGACCSSDDGGNVNVNASLGLTKLTSKQANGTTVAKTTDKCCETLSACEPVVVALTAASASAVDGKLKSSDCCGKKKTSGVKEDSCCEDANGKTSKGSADECGSSTIGEVKANGSGCCSMKGTKRMNGTHCASAKQPEPKASCCSSRPPSECSSSGANGVAKASSCCAPRDRYPVMPDHELSRRVQTFKSERGASFARSMLKMKSPTSMQKGMIPPATLRLSIGGMTCTGCCTRVEKFFSQQPGILSVKVSLLTARGVFEYDPVLITAESIEAMVANLGFNPSLLPSDSLVSIVMHIGHINTVRVAASVAEIHGVETVREVDDPGSPYLSQKALLVEYNPDVIGARSLISAASNRLGFPVHASSPQPQAIVTEQLEASKYAGLVIWSCIFSLPIIFVQYCLPLIFEDESNNPATYSIISKLSYKDAIGVICATPIVFFIAYPIHSSAFLALRFSSRVTMDVLISLSSLGAYLFSLVTVILEICKVSMDRSETFFEVSALLITLVMFGRYIEKIVKARASHSVDALLRIQAKTAILLEYTDGEPKESYVDIILVERNDLLKILPGARVPTDGVVVEGCSSVDESMITGESRKVPKEVGSTVIGGTINAQGVLIMRVTHTANESMLTRIVHLVDEAQSSKCVSQSIADVVSSHFTTFIISIALVMFVVWYEMALHNRIPTNGWAPFPFALRFAITILVISCPCAISLAVPTAIIVATTVGSQSGVLFKSGLAIEALEKVDVVMFDKTGTLTNGNLSVQSLKLTTSSNAPTSEKAWILLAAAEQHSEHAIGKAITSHAKTYNVPMRIAHGFVSIPGCGVECRVDGTHVRVGSFKWMNDTLHLDIPADLEEENKALQWKGWTSVCLALGDHVVGVIGFGDSPRPEAKFIIDQLKARRIQTWIVTGDQRETALTVADQLDVPEFTVLTDALPHQKVDKVRLLQSIGKNVAFVGDGVNDGPALAMADVGIAIGAGTDVAIESADLVLVKDDLKDLLNAFDLSRATNKVIRWNFLYGFLYNLVMMPIACGALYPFFGLAIPPAFAGLSELFSSVPVILFSLLLNYWKPRYVGPTMDDASIAIDIDRQQPTERTPLLEKRFPSNMMERKRRPVDDDGDATTITTQDSTEQGRAMKAPRCSEDEAREGAHALADDTEDLPPFVVPGLRHGSESWQGARRVNEDRCVSVLDHFPGPVFGVYDGHGGAFAVEFLVRNLVKNVTSAIKTSVGASHVDEVKELIATSTDERQRRQQIETQRVIFREQQEQLQRLMTDGEAAADSEVQVLDAQLQDSIQELTSALQSIEDDEIARTRLLRQRLTNDQPQIRQAITSAFQHTDEQLLKKSPTQDGSTALLVWFTGHEPTNLSYYAINLGDCRAVVCRGGMAVPLTIDHKPNRPSERQRIVKAGGFVANFAGIARVYNAAGAGLSIQPEKTTYLAVSRAFGDRPLKAPTPIVSHVPEISHHAVRDDDLLLVLACDGIWDVLSNQEAVQIALHHFGDPKCAADAIVKEAYRRGSKDNLTAVVIEFAWQADKVCAALQWSEENAITASAASADETTEQDSDEREEIDMFNL